MADFNLEALIKQVMDKLDGDNGAVKSFKKDPMTFVKNLLGKIDLDNDLLEKIVDAVKGKLDLDDLKKNAGGLLNKVKGLFGK